MARLKRLRPVSRKMSWAAFRRLPRLVGWRHEYIDGQAYLCPSYHHVRFRLALAPRDATIVRGLRGVEVADFGFREVPSASVAAARWRCYAYELERHEELGDLSPKAHAELVALERCWWDESERLEELQWRERRTAEKVKR